MGDSRPQVVSYHVRFPRQALRAARRDVRDLESLTFPSRDAACRAVVLHVRAFVDRYDENRPLPEHARRRVEALRRFEVVGRNVDGVEVFREEFTLPYEGLTEILLGIVRKEMFWVVLLISFAVIGVLNIHVIKVVAFLFAVYFVVFVLPLVLIRIVPHLLRSLRYSRSHSPRGR